jgi:hypothetical protein
MENLSQNHSLQVAETFSQTIQSFWVQLPDMHPTKVFFVKDKEPGEFMFPSVTVVPSLNMSRPSAKPTNPLA